MIPRLKPYLGSQEFKALFQRIDNAVSRFEDAFARKFEAKWALAFPYGRSALWAMFNAFGIENAEVIMPAYTCDVVAHAIVLSGNIPRFVDITLYDYNMDLNLVAEAITEKTKAVIATHLFGYPLDVDLLREIVNDAEARFGHKIWIIQDCAHSFGAQWKGRFVSNEGDVALYGLNISKVITSIFGGMLTTNDTRLYQQLCDWRDSHYKSPSALKVLRRQIYLMAVYPAFHESLYGLVFWLQEQTPFLDYLTKAYHLDEKIHFPPDFQDRMLPVEAQVGLVQLDKYSDIVQQHRVLAEYYSSQLSDFSINWVLPPLVEGATYSHFVLRLPEGMRAPLLKVASRFGLQLGGGVDYVVPEIDAYSAYHSRSVPNASLAARTLVNLPLHLTDIESASRVTKALKVSAKEVYGG